MSIRPDTSTSLAKQTLEGAQQLGQYSQDDIQAFEKNGSVDLNMDGETVVLELSDVETMCLLYQRYTQRYTDLLISINANHP